MNNRRRIVGVVTSNKMTKTVVVEFTRKFRHPLYRKVVFTSKRVKAHDEIGCQIGDEVQIIESRPISRDKRWVVEKIVKILEAEVSSKNVATKTTGKKMQVSLLVTKPMKIWQRQANSKLNNCRAWQGGLPDC